jgi:hypothetical protein
LPGSPRSDSFGPKHVMPRGSQCRDGRTRQVFVGENQHDRPLARH